MGPVFTDALNLVSKITAKRAVNLFRLYASYYYSRFRNKAAHRGRPYTISIEPTTSCNLRCPECPSGLRQFTRPTGKLSFELFQKVIDQLSPELFYLILYFQGEPYLNPLFFRFVEYAHAKKIYTATSTNAHFLYDDLARKTVESGLDKLIVSLDGLDQSTYEKYRVGGSVEKVYEGIGNLKKWKHELRSKTPFIELQFIVFKTNEHQVDDVRKMARNRRTPPSRMDSKKGSPSAKFSLTLSISTIASLTTTPVSATIPKMLMMDRS
mgnify:CR=1 FL=1